MQLNGHILTLFLGSGFLLWAYLSDIFNLKSLITHEDH